MTRDVVPVEGACLCGQVRLRISKTPFFTAVCHCSGCKKLASSAFSLTVAVPAEGFEVTQGEPVIGALHGPHQHFYCPHCMSWMFTRPHGFDFFVNVRSTLLDNDAWTTPFLETGAAHKLPWVTTPAPHSFAEFPGEADIPGILEGFAREMGANS
ncbi:MAG: GFA family protein [Hyphomonadaceae bacterium]|nr:GFA family protein [Hyphomonadaceae bacterium]